MTMKDEFPNGLCPKCGLFLMNSQGGKICPNCSTSSPPSGLVNTIQDPGHEAFVKGTFPKAKQEISIMVPPKDAVLPRIVGGSYISLLDAVEKLPMPNDMKSIKKLLKVKQLLQELTKES